MATPDDYRQLQQLMDDADKHAPLELCIFNVGANVNFPILETTDRVFRKVWEMACWSGFLVGADKMRPKRINGVLGLAGDERIHGALMLGYPKYTYNVKLPRKARKVTLL